VDELIGAIDSHRDFLVQDGRLDHERQIQAQQWLVEAVRERWGREGIARAGDLGLPQGTSPFRRLAELNARLKTA